MDVHYVDVTTRTTKEYKKYCEDNNIEICMLAKEKQEIEAIVSIMKKNITFFDAIYNSSNQYEVPAVKELFGIQWKGKADIVCNDCIIDLKTTVSHIHRICAECKRVLTFTIESKIIKL